MVLSVGEQQELFTALGWASTGGRKLLPTLNISLRTSLSSVAHRGGEEVGRHHSAGLTLMPQWA